MLCGRGELLDWGDCGQFSELHKLPDRVGGFRYVIAQQCLQVCRYEPSCPSFVELDQVPTRFAPNIYVAIIRQTPKQTDGCQSIQQLRCGPGNPIPNDRVHAGREFTQRSFGSRVGSKLLAQFVAVCRRSCRNRPSRTLNSNHDFTVRGSDCIMNSAEKINMSMIING